MDSCKQPPASGALPDKLPRQGSKSVGGTNVVTASAVDDNCILFGRGKGCNNNPANARMRGVIDQYRDEYEAAGRGGKKLVVLKVHKELVEAGMKFLKQEKGIDGWIEAEAAEAITKVGHAIRWKRSKCKSEEDDSDSKPQAAQLQAVEDPEASVPGQVVQDNLSGVVQGDVAASLALDNSALATSRARVLSNNDALLLGHHQQILGRTLPIGPINPLYSLEGLAPIDLAGGLIHPPPLLGASRRLAQPPPSMALNGLSAADIYVLMDRERRLRQTMLYDHIFRNL